MINKLVIIISIVLLILLTLIIIGKKEIKTSIDIEASPEEVWKILVYFEEYENWNPFIKSVEGNFSVGNKVKIRAGDMRFSPKVLVFEENKEIRWLGKLLVTGIFNGEHSFKLIDNSDGSTTFEHEEKFTGILVGLAAKKLEKDTKSGFEAMNLKLKQLAEANRNIK